MMNDTVRNRIITIARVLFVAALLFTFYKATAPCLVEPQPPYKDKVLHAFAFFMLYLLAEQAFPEHRHFGRKVLFLVAFGVVIELVQFFLPWRSAEMMDVVADCAGIALCVAPASVIRRMMGLRGEGVA
jgi:VanZ family protein